MKIYNVINNSQKTTINTDKLLSYTLKDKTFTVNLEGFSFNIVFYNLEDAEQSYNHLHLFMTQEY